MRFLILLAISLSVLGCKPSKYDCWDVKRDDGSTNSIKECDVLVKQGEYIDYNDPADWMQNFDGVILDSGYWNTLIFFLLAIITWTAPIAFNHLFSLYRTGRSNSIGPWLALWPLSIPASTIILPVMGMYRGWCKLEKYVQKKGQTKSYSKPRTIDP